MKKTFYSLLLLPCFLSAQNTSSIDFLTGNADLNFDLSEHKIKGTIVYTFSSETEKDSISIDAKAMQINDVKINNKTIPFVYANDKITCYDNYKIGKNTLEINYEAIPKQALYFTGTGNDIRIWTQGQGKNNSHWIPSFDDPNEKVIFGLSIHFDKKYHVISNGLLKKVTQKDNSKIWQYQMEQPMSSYLLMLAIGNYEKNTIKSSSGIVIENYHFTNDANKYKATYSQTSTIFDFLENTIGVAYPWEIYRNIPVDDFMYGGMENTTSTIFSTRYCVDDIGINDYSYQNVNAHEMAHQWFGDLITQKSREDHWIHEGFATYYALISDRNLKGNEYFYWRLYEMAEEITKDAKDNKNTVVASKGATTTSYYSKGAWCIFYLSTQIGEANLKKVVQNVLHKYAYKNLSTDDFIAEIKEVVPSYDTSKFKQWLYNPSFDVQTALQLIGNSPWVASYLHLIDLKNKPFEEKKDELYTILTDENQGYPARKEVIYQLAGVDYHQAKSFYDYVAQSKNLKIRQALLQIIDIIPDDFLAQYKTFLNDNSYINQELAMKNLWINKKDYHEELLNKMRKSYGFYDKNLRISWLMLALKTPNYRNKEKASFYRELEHYASRKYNSDTRKNAILALWFLNKNDSNVLPQLINGLVHHDSRFVQFCKNSILTLCQRKEYKEYFERQIPILPTDEHIALKKLMEQIKK